MAASLNKVMIIGHLGNDPDIRTMQSGGRVCNLSIATSENWKDKNTGERREKTEWHRAVVFNEGLISICERYLAKGSKIFLEGALETRKWQDQNGNDRYSTEIVLKPYNGNITMLDTAINSNGQQPAQQQAETQNNNDWQSPQYQAQKQQDNMEDDIPFS